MANLVRRQNSVQRILGSYLAPAASYSITAYEAGAQASAGSAGTTITVRAGHGFAASDKILINPGSANTFSGSDTVQSVTATSIVMGQSYTISSGDVIFNLGTDTGTTTPNYDGSPLFIYSDMAGAGTAIINETVTTASDGEYGYWHHGVDIWELVRDSSGTTVDYVQGVSTGGQDLATRYADAWATGGTGTWTDPWTGWESAATGFSGVVKLRTGVFSTNSGVVLSQGATLDGSGNAMVLTDFDTSSGTILKSGGTWSGTAIVSVADNSGLAGITVRGMRIVGATGVPNGILFDSTKRSTIQDVMVEKTDAEGIYLSRTGAAGTGEQTTMIRVQVADATRGTISSQTGAVRVHHTDSHFYDVRAFTNLGTTYTSGYRAGFYITATANWFTNCFADLNEIGWYLDIHAITLTGCRADYNSGHGFILTSNAYTCNVIGCQAWNNSQATTNTYDAFQIAGTRNNIIGCASRGTVTNKHRYVYNQTGVFGASNKWVGNTSRSDSYSTGLFYDVNGSGGWSVQKGYIIASADDATPSVLDISVLAVGSTNSTPTAITQLDDGIPGQVVTVFANAVTNYASIADSGNFNINGAWTPIATGDSITLFTLNGTLWYEQCRSQDLNSKLFQGSTYDANRTTLSVVDPTGARTINLPDVSGNLLTDAQELRAGADSGGVASKNTLTSASSLGAAGATFTVKGVSGATARDSAGFIKFYIGTTAYYVPVWAAITG